ncbi:MAG: metal-sensitive transcriptional regulator [Candidatus Taylorbacteria bacterium]|nr:metal-sensitive transcriptional regulator [Candidatus Taylorbacteria bacterium]
MKTDIKKSVLRRLKIAAGQIGGLERMVLHDTYCVDIITQSAAVREALSGIERLMLQNHLATHVVHQMKSGKSKQAVDEIIKIYRFAQKKK